jgi:hypothetical protein
MNLKHNRILVSAGICLAFILLSPLSLSANSEILAQGTNTTNQNTTNVTAASAGEVSPITYHLPVMPPV